LISALKVTLKYS